ncbi:type II toxin-antitoxin system RelE/ParE family toxin [Kitasatospora sp. NPDC090091]|uniref:type II toxin-antitoxin system RelE family toxin n=1 Tax=Kitasatospora sp. NPDC090091 TaxID=3364081 RepID=UPI0037F13626
MSRAKFGFSAHPEAIADLRQLPDTIRDQALMHLQDLVHGERVAKRLDGRLEGCHKIYLGAGDQWASHRPVVQFRDAQPDARHAREVYLVAAGPRLDYAVYRSAQNRLCRTGPNLPDSPGSAEDSRVRAAHDRSTRPAAAAVTGAAYTTASPGCTPNPPAQKAR